MKNKVVLAYSGGLDTSYCVIYLTRDLGLEVHSVLVDTGGFTDDELKQVEKRAYEMGVTSHRAVDETQNYYESSIKYLIFGNVLKNRSEEHTSELQSRENLVCRLLLEKKKKNSRNN